MIARALRSRGILLLSIVIALALLYLGRQLVVQSVNAQVEALAKANEFRTHDEALLGVAVANGTPEASQPVQVASCPLQLDWLEELDGVEDLRWPLMYSRRDIVVRPKPWTEHSSLLKAPETLLPKFQQLDSPYDQRLQSSHCPKPLILDVPVASKPDASHILFGGASNLARVEASMSFYERWFAHTGARMILSVVGPEDSMPDPAQMEDLQMRMRSRGMAVTLVPPLKQSDSFVQRYFSLVKTMYESIDEKTKWLGFVDDDTFIVSMNALVDMLARHNAEELHYLGALSEEWWTVAAYGLVGMGGAGIFMTLPVARVIHENYQDCKDHTTKIFGDHIVYECIEHHTDIRLQHIDGLFQIDLHGDRSGVWESGRRIITLHHWKEGYWSEDGSGLDGIRHSRWFPIDKMALIKDICGEDCYLQRFLFGKDTILTNGYAIASYPTGALKRKEMRLDQMERTWATPVLFPDDANQHVAGSGNDGYDHYLCPCRPALELEKEKIHWRFMDAKVVPGGGLRQYFRRVGREGRMDELVELFWSREQLEKTQQYQQERVDTS